MEKTQFLRAVHTELVMETDLPDGPAVAVKVIPVSSHVTEYALQIMGPTTLLFVGHESEERGGKTGSLWPTPETAVEYAETRGWTVVEE